ncbi:carbohydrate ABC transporter permease [Cohnella cholangitidis]|uniref:Carbohydrate ABC transporter permease n=1 Tax=Cohnella cholangitidis TaxID=2598458 RepID=A0A7G5C2E6_9BACL|nr:carbohydrate ABC transporter permease [Cohnella cholangitidis]QMV43380.1 carbohydrate ABC transporter permease [Cohnella cholangitidis]
MSRLTIRATVVLLLVIGAGCSLYPIFYMLSTAFQPATVILEYPPRWWPSEPTWIHFEEAWSSQNFGRSLLNSFFVTVVSFLILFLLSSMLAFSYSRFHFTGRKLSWSVLMACLTIPAMTLIIPQFVMIRDMNLYDSYWALLLIYTAGGIPFTTFLLKGFFDSVSREIDESVLMDGGSSGLLFARILLPLSKPAFVPAIIFNVLFIWEEFPWALTVINDPAKRTLPVALANFQGQYTTQWGVVFAGSLLALLPVLVLFLLLQRYFIQGMTEGSVKG